MKAQRIIASIIFFILAKSAFACPFCDNGGVETATFIALTFGCLALTVLCIFLLVKRAGLLHSGNETGRTVLDAEQIKTRSSHE